MNENQHYFAKLTEVLESRGVTYGDARFVPSPSFHWMLVVYVGRKARRVDYWEEKRVFVISQKALVRYKVIEEFYHDDQVDSDELIERVAGLLLD